MESAFSGRFASPPKLINDSSMILAHYEDSSRRGAVECFFEGLFIKAIINGVLLLLHSPPIEHTIN